MTSGLCNFSFFCLAMSMGMVLAFSPVVYLSELSRFQLVVNLLMKELISGWSQTHARQVPGVMQTLSAVFMMILGFNLIAALPYTYSLTAQLYFAMGLALPLWSSFMISGAVKGPYSFFGGFVPGGSPLAMAPLLALIEVVSTLIRPVSLSLRLVVNIAAGHCLLSLISQLCASLISAGSVGVVFVLVIHMGYMMFEVGVSFIQAYIFTTLLSLYIDEHPVTLVSLNN